MTPILFITYLSGIFDEVVLGIRGLSYWVVGGGCKRWPTTNRQRRFGLRLLSLQWGRSGGRSKWGNETKQFRNSWFTSMLWFPVRNRRKRLGRSCFTRFLCREMLYFSGSSARRPTDEVICNMVGYWPPLSSRVPQRQTFSCPTSFSSLPITLLSSSHPRLAPHSTICGPTASSTLKTTTFSGNSP